MRFDMRCICGSEMRRKYFSTNFDSNICENCKSVHFIPKKNKNPVEFNYSGADEKYSSQSYLYGSELRWAHNELLKLNWAGRKILEVGCFNGFFLKELASVGAQVFGQDLNEKAIAVGEKLFGLSGKLKTSIDSLNEHSLFDDVLCIDLLEHLDSPEELLHDLKPRLVCGGRLYIAGPTIERRFHDKSDYPPHHKWWFSRKGLELFLRNYGYKVVDVKIQRNGILMLRNFIGKLISGFSKKEFYGTGVTFSENNKSKRVYKFIESFGVIIFTLLRINYCSTLLIAERVE